MVRGLTGLVAAVAVLALPGAARAADCNLPGPADQSLAPSVTITGEFASDLEGGYSYVPFDVPAGTTAVRVRYCHDEPELAPPLPLPNIPKHVLDLGLYEPRASDSAPWGTKEFRGSAGSSVRDVTVAPNGFTPDAVYEQDRKAHVAGATMRGFGPGPIPAGEWAVELGLAAIASTSEFDSDGQVAWTVQVQLSQDPLWADDPYAPTAYDETPVDPDSGWYAGDLHVHGEHEPGNATMRETFDYAFAPYGGDGAGLDFVTLVDHNNVNAYDEIGRYQPDYPAKLIVRSTEVTTYRGHVQNHASGELVDYRTGPLLEAELTGTGAQRTLAGLTQARPARQASELLGDIRAAGGVTQINHPSIFPSQVPTFDDFCRGCAWSYSATDTDYGVVDAVEVATGPAGLQTQPNPGPNPFTPLAIRFYEDAIDSGGTNSNHIAAVGSSDSHKAPKRSEINPVGNIFDAPIGMATTMIHADELSEVGIRKGIADGHTYVKVWGADGPDLRLEASENGSPGPPAIMGDTLEADAATITAEVGNMAAAAAARPGAYTLVLMRDGSPLLSVPVPLGQDSFEFELPSLGIARYGLMVQRVVSGGASVEAYATPVWIEPDSGEPPPPPPSDCSVKVTGTDGPDVFAGTPESDSFEGLRGRDRLAGQGDVDCLDGGRGGDVITGGPGEDILRGRKGRDRIKSVDGEPDWVGCGGGHADRARVDALDVVRGCERVRRSP